MQKPCQKNDFILNCCNYCFYISVKFEGNDDEYYRFENGCYRFKNVCDFVLKSDVL